MFNKEELLFIETLLSDELFLIKTKMYSFEDYNKTKEYKLLIKDREDYIEKLLEKIRKEDKIK